MNEERQTSEHVLTLDAGSSMTGGGGLGDATRGEAIVAGMNLIEYDAMNIGRKDLTLGMDALKDRFKQAGFPIISANLTLEDADDPFASTHTIVDRGGHRFGVVGITGTPETMPPGFDVLDPELVLSAIVPSLRESVGTVILLTDLPLEDAQALVKRTPGIDLVVAGDPEFVPDHAAAVPSTNTIAVCAENPTPRHTGRRVGRLAVTVDTDGSLRDADWSTNLLDGTYADDPAMDELLKQYEIPY